MNNTLKDTGLGLGGILLALTGGGLLGEGPLAAMLGATPATTGAAGAAGAAGAGAAGATGAGAAGAAGTGAATGAGAAGTAGATGAATGASGAAGAAAPTAATAAIPSHVLGSATPLVGQGLMSTGIGATGKSIMDPSQTQTTPGSPVTPPSAPNFQQLMSMFPSAKNGQSMYGPFA